MQKINKMVSQNKVTNLNVINRTIVTHNKETNANKISKIVVTQIE